MDSERYEAAQRAIDAMHEFWKLQPQQGAVQWLEDTEGRVLIFTRGEYRNLIMAAIAGSGAPMHEVEYLEAAPETLEEKIKKACDSSRLHATAECMATVVMDIINNERGDDDGETKRRD